MGTRQWQPGTIALVSAFAALIACGQPRPAPVSPSAAVSARAVQATGSQGRPAGTLEAPVDGRLPSGADLPSEMLYTEPLTAAVGVVRHDAILLPIATLRGGRWSATVREFEGRGSYAIVLAPEARTLIGQKWLAFPLAGGLGASLAVGEVNRVDALCTPVEGFRTDATAQPVPANRSPDDTSALALLGAGNVAAPEVLTAPFGAAASTVVSAIEALTPSLESSLIDAGNASSLRRHAPADRGAIAIQITHLVRHSRDGVTRYYFEAIKRYSDDIVFAAGWLTEHNSQLHVVNASAMLTDDDRKGVSSATVLGIIELPGRTVWVLAESSYESRGLSLMEFGAGTTGRIVARVANGAC